MASELSQFIEKEHKTQAVGDDEKKRLLEELRAEPLPTVPPPFYKNATFKKLTIVLAVLAVVVLAIVGVTLSGGGQSLSTGLWNGGGGKGADSMGSSQAAMDTSREGTPKHDTGKGEMTEQTKDKAKDKAKDKDEKSPLPPSGEKNVEGVDKVQREDEDDVEDYVGEDVERPKFDEERSHEDYEEVIEKMEEARHGKKEPKSPADGDQSGLGATEQRPPVKETARAADPFDVDYAADYADYAMVRDPVTPEKE